MPDGRQHRRPLDRYTLRRRHERAAGKRDLAALILERVRALRQPAIRMRAYPREWTQAQDIALLRAIAAGADDLAACVSAARPLVTQRACERRWRELREGWS
jgi:hypothetical protein